MKRMGTTSRLGAWLGRRLPAAGGTVLVLLGASLAFPAANSAGAAAEIPDLSVVAKAHRTQEESLKSLYVKYRYGSRLLGSASDVRKYVGARFVSSQTKVFAFKGNKRYYSFERTASLADTDFTVSDLTETGPDGKPQVYHLAANTVVAFDGQTFRRRGPGGGSASVFDGSGEEHDLGFFNPEYMGLGLRTLPDVANPKNDRAEFRLPGAIAKGQCRMRPGLETVDGAPCVVIEMRQTEARQEMTLWCDPALAYTVRREEGYYPDSKQVERRSTSSDFVEVCPGVWMPRKAVSERFPPPSAPASLHRTALFAYDTNVIEIHANDVPNELFALKIPPGVIVLDYIHGTTDEKGQRLSAAYQMPADQRELDRIVQSIQGDGPKPGWPRWLRNSLFGLFLLCGALLVVLAVLRRRRVQQGQSLH